jgi:outer membrane protein TolC
MTSAGLMLGAIGCDLLTGDRPGDLRVHAQQLREVQVLDLPPTTQPATSPAGVGQGNGLAPSAPTTAPAQMDLRLEDARAAALRNNLDLQVELMSPSIVNEALREQQARFDWLFVLRTLYAKEDPVLGSLGGIQSESLEISPGLAIPLQTGGTLSFDAPLTRTQTEDTLGPTGALYIASGRATISQPLLQGAGVRTNTIPIRIARYQVQISEARTKLEIIRVLAAVDRGYWQLLAARRQLEVRRLEYDLATEQLERARRQVEAGEAADVEIIRAQAGVAERLEGIIVADNALRDRQRDLKRIMNLPGVDLETQTVLIPVTEPQIEAYELDPHRLSEAAVANRMEMIELELQIAQDALRVDLARNQTLPLLAVDYSYRLGGLGGDAADAWDMCFDNHFQDQLFGLRLEVPVTNQAARSRLRAAVLSRIQRLITPQARAQRIRQEVHMASDGLQAAWQRVQAGRHRSELEHRLLEAEQRQFMLGLQTSTDVLEAQARYADALSAEIQAVTDYQIAKVDIAFATGTTLGADSVIWEPTRKGGVGVAVPRTQPSPPR